MQNIEIARRFEEVAELLGSQGASPYQAQAYYHGAQTFRKLPKPVQDIYRDEGWEGLKNLPGIGPRLSYSVRDLILTGRLPILERLRGETDPMKLLRTVPGIGPVTAARLHHDLGIDSLYDLEAAAHVGLLAEVAGIGKKRIAGFIDSLGSRLGRVRAAYPPHEANVPPVSELLDVDHQYRELAAAGTLRRIAPRRFNPGRIAWLPILHADYGHRHYTALFSNTARAHQLGKTRDWVILYVDGGLEERQWTVITSQRGRLRGKRIVRGREDECEAHYGHSASLAS
jgi:hypothetical protein